MPSSRNSHVSAQDGWLQRSNNQSMQGHSREMSKEKASQKFLQEVSSSKQRIRKQNLSVRTNKSTPNSTYSQELNNKHKIPVMPSSTALPLWLQRLNALHRYSSVTTFLVVASTLLIYGWTVYSQQLWSQNYKRLQNLHRNERQLTTTTENLKNKIAQDAEKPSAGLASPSPEGTIYLPPASGNQLSRPQKAESQEEIPQQNSAPVGY